MPANGLMLDLCRIDEKLFPLFVADVGFGARAAVVFTLGFAAISLRTFTSAVNFALDAVISLKAAVSLLRSADEAGPELFTKLDADAEGSFFLALAFFREDVLCGF